MPEQINANVRRVVRASHFRVIRSAGVWGVYPHKYYTWFVVDEVLHVGFKNPVVEDFEGEVYVAAYKDWNLVEDFTPPGSLAKAID